MSFALSYPYRVVVTKGVEESIQASDRSERVVELPPILDRKTTQDLFEKALKDRGWEGDGNTLTKKGDDGLVQTVDLETGVVVTTAEGDTVIEKKLTLEGHGDSWGQPTAADKESLKQQVEARIDKRLKITEKERESRRRELEKDLAERLEKSEEARTEELNAALLEVYAESLKEKAKGMGTISEVREERCPETGEYELVIRIEE